MNSEAIARAGCQRAGAKLHRAQTLLDRNDLVEGRVARLFAYMFTSRRIAGYDRREMSETEKNLSPRLKSLGGEWQAEDVMHRIRKLLRRFY